MTAAVALSIAILWGGYLLLYQLLSVRPQFVGLNLQSVESWLLQDCPSFVSRKVGDPSYAYTHHSPRSCDVVFEMRTNEDKRGLKVIRSLSGECKSVIAIENPHAEPSHVLLRIPRPEELKGGPIDISSFRLKAPNGLEGKIHETPGAILWSGQLAGGQRVEMEASYGIPAVSSVSFAVDPQSPQGMEEISVAVNFGQDVPLVLQGGTDTGKRVDKSSQVWKRENIMSSGRFGVRLQDGHSVFQALQRLLQIAPLVGCMFVITLLALLKRGRKAQPSELLILTGVYGYYFPLLLYLNARYPFHWAFIIAFCASSAILLNYARFLLGFKKGVLGGLCLLGLFQVVPTLMAFARWDRGMCLLSLSAFTLFVLVDMQTQKLKERISSGALAACALFPPLVGMPEFPAPLFAVPVVAESAAETQEPPPKESVLFRGEAYYEAKVLGGTVKVLARMPVKASAALSTREFLLPTVTALKTRDLPEFLRVTVDSAGAWIRAEKSGVGEVCCLYEAATTSSAQRTKCRVSLYDNSEGKVRFESPHQNVRFSNAVVLSKEVLDGMTIFELSVHGGSAFEATWDLKAGSGGNPDDSGAIQRSAGTGLYELDIVNSCHLTIIEADGAVLHFAQFTITNESKLTELSLTIPPGSEITSVSIDGIESTPPVHHEGSCTVPLGNAPRSGKDRLVELRIRLAPVTLAFRGRCTLQLPKTVGTEKQVEWAIATPDDFEVEVRSGGFKPMREWRSQPRFGDYGTILEGTNLLTMSAALMPARPMSLELLYEQIIPGFTDSPRGPRGRL
jgi:hypothetical protein